MRIFSIMELLIILAIVWFIANIVKYIAFKQTEGKGFFGLSERWLKKEGLERKPEEKIVIKTKNSKIRDHIKTCTHCQAVFELGKEE